MSLFWNDMLNCYQNYKCCMNGVLEVSTEKDMMEASMIKICENNMIF